MQTWKVSIAKRRDIIVAIDEEPEEFWATFEFLKYINFQNVDSMIYSQYI